MRLTLYSIQDVCEEVKEQAEFIYDQTVRFHVQPVPQQTENVSRDILVVITAVMEKDFLIEFMQPSGEDGPGDQKIGSDLASAWIEQLQSACDAVGLRLRSGKLELT